MPSIRAIITALALASYALAAPAPVPQDSPELADGVIFSDPAAAAGGPEVNSFAAATFADGTYKKTVLKHHNVHRANHSAPNIAWGSNMATWAKTVAEGCVWKHNTYVWRSSHVLQ